MSDPKEIFLQPECCAIPGEGRLWCEHDAPQSCTDGVPWTRYVRADEIERLERELAVLTDNSQHDLKLLTEDAQTIKRLERELAEARKDAARYRWLRKMSARSLACGIEINDPKLYYEEPEPGKEVRLYWYPYTPIGFNEAAGSTLDEAVDEAMAAETVSEMQK